MSLETKTKSPIGESLKVVCMSGCWEHCHGGTWITRWLTCQYRSGLASNRIWPFPCIYFFFLRKTEFMHQESYPLPGNNQPKLHGGVFSKRRQVTDDITIYCLWATKAIADYENTTFGAYIKMQVPHKCEWFNETQIKNILGLAFPFSSLSGSWTNAKKKSPRYCPSHGMQWHRPITQLERQSHKDHEFEDSLDNIVKSLSP